MKIYLVGGAVRDALLKREVTERDFVVVGATPEDLLAKGFRPVGKDFPVFLHPNTQEEYALARTERKTGKGYTGFECFFDPTVTLEQDLLRRDLTINAMAQEWDALTNTPKGDIIDPFQGKLDLSKKLLRHVSPAFTEDPVRILRVARFAARFSEFRVDTETNLLMRNMVDVGEINALVPERVWKEFSRALTEKDPVRFFDVLKDCRALPILFPEFIEPGNHNRLISLQYLKRSLTHSKTDSRELPHLPPKKPHTAKVFATSSNIKSKLTAEDRPHEIACDLLRFGALTLELNEKKVTTLCQRLRTPARFTETAHLIVKNLNPFAKINIDDPRAIVNFLERIDAYRRAFRLFDFCQIVNLTQAAHQSVAKITEALTHAFEATREIDAHPFIQGGLTGEAIGKAIHAARIEKLKSTYNNSGTGIDT